YRESVPYHAQIREPEDRSVRILVDRHDPLRSLHAGDVLECAADADGDVHLRFDRLARLTDLVAVRHPARVDHCPGSSDRGVTYGSRERIQQSEVGRVLQAASTCDHHASFLDLGARGRFLPALDPASQRQLVVDLSVDGYWFGCSA